MIYFYPVGGDFKYDITVLDALFQKVQPYNFLNTKF